MDHLCYLDLKEREYGKLLSGEKTKLARGTRRKKQPYKYVFSGDRIFFVNEKLEIVLRGEVADVINVKKSDVIKHKELILTHKDDLSISQRKVKKLMKKNYLVLISICNVEKVEKCNYQNIGRIKRKKWILASNVKINK